MADAGGGGHHSRCDDRGTPKSRAGLGLFMGDDRSEESTRDHDDRNSGATNLFPDAATMKEKLRQNMLKPEYDVCNFYHTAGWCQRVARSSIFENMTLSVIAFNALWISIDTDYNNAAVLLEARPVFQIMEHFFCAYFTWEWTIRFLSFKRKRNGLRDPWFVFDSFMVFMMVAETWVMSIILLASGAGAGSAMGNASILRLLRLLRLSRMARMAKLLRSMPELLILIKGMLSAMRSVGITMLLLFVIIYVFAIAFRQLTDQTTAGKLYFSSISKSMHTLLLDGTLLDGTGNVITELENESVVFVALFYIFVLLAALTVMNMLIGVLCEVVSAVASTEREQIVVATVKDGFEAIIEKGGLDMDGDHMISKKEFVAILDIPQAVNLLNRVDVDVYELVDLADFIFAGDDEGEEGGEQLTLTEFLEMVLSLRGSNTATVKDIVELRKFIKTRFEKLYQAVSTNGLSWVSEGKKISRQPSKCPSATQPGGKAPAPPHLGDHMWTRVAELEGVLRAALGCLETFEAGALQPQGLSPDGLATVSTQSTMNPETHVPLDRKNSFSSTSLDSSQDGREPSKPAHVSTSSAELKARMKKLNDALTTGLGELRTFREQMAQDSSKADSKRTRHSKPQCLR